MWPLSLTWIMTSVPTLNSRIGIALPDGVCIAALDRLLFMI